MAESVHFSLDLPVSPERVYRAWLDSYEFSRFTGSPAKIDPEAGGDYSVLKGDIHGKTLVASPFSGIVQTWRTPGFALTDPDSRVEIKLEPTCLGAMLTLTHTGIPKGQSRHVLKTWEERIFRPLRDYFEALVGDQAVDIDG